MFFQHKIKSLNIFRIGLVIVSTESLCLEHDIFLAWGFTLVQSNVDHLFPHGFKKSFAMSQTMHMYLFYLVSSVSNSLKKGKPATVKCHSRNLLHILRHT